MTDEIQTWIDVLLLENISGGLLAKITTEPQIRDFSSRLVGKIFEFSFFPYYSKCNFHNSVHSLP